MESSSPLLEMRALNAFYGDFQALFAIDFRIERNEIVAIIGSNGAGKSTLLKSIIGLIRAKPEAIFFNGKPIGGNPVYRMIRQGISLVPEGRRLFSSLTVEENLSIGAYGKRRGPWHIEAVYKAFPMLKEKRKVAAMALSGGQQQMVAIGRALMANPQILLCDEISLGLAPVIVKELYAQLKRINANGTTLIVVEQDIKQVMSVSDRVYCVRKGRVVLEGRPSDLSREDVAKGYFGT
jgi:branched-chain amino acid transport system ATP-binding protein